MSYKRTSPQPIVEGGTNAGSMTNTFGINYFDGTRIVTTAVGTATHVLTSNGAGVAPTFQASPGGGGVTGPGSSTDRALATWNGTGGSALFDNSTTKITSGGIMTNTAQPSFLIYATQVSTNPVTGNNATYLLKTANEGWTALYDTTSGISTFVTGQIIYTTPVAGTYIFTYKFSLTAATTANYGYFLISTGSGVNVGNEFSSPSSQGIYNMGGSFMVQLPAADTIFFEIVVQGNGANDLNIDPAGTFITGTYGAFVSGCLLC